MRARSITQLSIAGLLTVGVCAGSARADDLGPEPPSRADARRGNVGSRTDAGTFRVDGQAGGDAAVNPRAGRSGNSSRAASARRLDGRIA